MSCTNNTETVELSVTGGVLEADVIVDPDPANALRAGTDGLFVTGQNETGWFELGADVEEWIYAGADAPTYYFSVVGDKTDRYSIRQRIRFKQGGGFQYGIITAVSYDAGTALTTVAFYAGTDWSLANADITDNAFSGSAAPTGFPVDPTKWQETLTDTADRTQSNPVSGTWYNLGALQLTIPIGAWDIDWQASFRATLSSGAGSISGRASLSTATSSESDKDFTAMLFTGTSSNASNRYGGNLEKRKTLTLAAKEVHYLIGRVDDSNGSAVGFYGSTYGSTLITARCAYL